MHTQSQTNACELSCRQCLLILNIVRCNARTGSFHNPAHNCSHIAQSNFNVTSGTRIHVHMCSIAVTYVVAVCMYN